MIETEDRVNKDIFQEINSLLTKDKSSLDLGSSISSILERFNTIHSETAQHCLRTGTLARMLAEKVGIEGRDLEFIFLGGALHDIGKVADVLLVEDGLNDEEFEFVSNNDHTVVGSCLLSDMNFPAVIVDIVRDHHKHFLKMEELKISTQIVMVADTYDAILSPRFYQQGTSREQALIRLSGSFGIRFDESLRIPFEKVVRDQLSL